MVIITIVTSIIYLFTENFIFSKAAAILNLISLTIFFSADFILWNKSLYGRFFAIAYDIPLFFAYDYYLSPHVGVKFLNLLFIFYKFGSIAEMIVFIYTIMYQAKILSTEKKSMSQKLIDYTSQLKIGNKDLSESKPTINSFIAKFSLTIKEVKVLASKKQIKRFPYYLIVLKHGKISLKS